MDTSEIFTSDDVIKDSATNDQLDAFGSLLQNLEQDELDAINVELNAGVAEHSDWRDYWDAFAQYRWHEFAHAFREVNGHDPSL